MRAFIVTALCLIGANVSSCGLTKAYSASLHVNEATIKRVIDADTFVADVRLWQSLIVHDEHIRVRHVDTPEKRGSGCRKYWRENGILGTDIIKRYENRIGREASEYVRALMRPGDVVGLFEVGQGKYRLLGDVMFADRKSTLSELLLSTRRAVPYEGQAKGAWWCERAWDQPAAGAMGARE